MVKINELLKMIESQEKAGGESCTPGTELELGENIVDSYGKVSVSHHLGFIVTYYDSSVRCHRTYIPRLYAIRGELKFNRPLK